MLAFAAMGWKKRQQDDMLDKTLADFLFVLIILALICGIANVGGWIRWIRDFLHGCF